jgi:TonB family protein
VLASGGEGQTYAASILKVCEFCLQSPAVCVAGVTGADLKTRVEAIMTFEKTQALRPGHRAVLAMTTVMTIAVPLAVGALRDDRSAIPASITGDLAGPPAAIEPAALVQPARQAATGGVTGVVTDPSGARVVGAVVVIADADSQRTAVTDIEGRYAQEKLVPGQYALVVQVMGFKPSKTLIQIEPGFDVNQDVRLALGTVRESLTVAGRSAANAAFMAQTERDARAVTMPLVRIAAAGETVPDLAPPPSPQGGPVRVGGDIKAPKKIRDVKPVYPPDALAAGLQGIVIMEATIGTDGAVTGVSVIRSIPGLDQAAVDAVQQWRFTPTTLNGEPVEVLMTVTVNFTLQ